MKKFRAWINDEKMHYDICVMFCPGEIRKHRIYTSSDWYKDYVKGEFLANDNNSVVMQYTGLKDKYGKDVYEGDILETIKGTGMGVVVFYKTGWMLEQYDGVCYDILENSKNFKIIGNIHENKKQ